MLDVETRGGITGMGYLFLFRPAMRTIAACLDECVIPRVIGKDASAVEAIWQDLWRATVTYGRGGIAVFPDGRVAVGSADGLAVQVYTPDLKPNRIVSLQGLDLATPTVTAALNSVRARKTIHSREVASFTPGISA